MINILNPDGTLNDNVPEQYRGLTVHEGPRSAWSPTWKQPGLVVEIEDREIDLAHSDRSKTPIEPYLADQWFVKMDELAQTAMDAVTDGRVKIIPDALRQGLSRLAQRKTRLAHQPAALVGTSDSGLDVQYDHAVNGRDEIDRLSRQDRQSASCLAEAETSRACDAVQLESGNMEACSICVRDADDEIGRLA